MKFSAPLSKLLQSAALEPNALPHSEITSLCCDSRAALPGCLFFALPGSREDGAKYLAEAARKGAVAAICDASVMPAQAPARLKIISVPNAREIMARMANAFYQQPSQRFYLSGITGTNGKTTTTYLLESLWGAVSSGVIGTVNTRYAGSIEAATHTTPESIVLQEILAKMAAANCKTVAVEVSSHALEQDRVRACAFDSALFTNLTQDHLDYHHTMADYFAAKRKLFTTVLPESSKVSKRAIINIDDPYGQKLALELKNSKCNVQTFAIHNPDADIRVKSASYTLSGIDAELLWRGQACRLKSNLLGAHNLSNLLGAFCVGEHSGLNFDEMAGKVAHVAVPGRLQRVPAKTKPNFFVDYAHTPDALENVLTALRAIMPKNHSASAKLWVLFGCGGDRDTSKRPLMGEAAAKLADAVMITSDNPRTEDPEKIIADILPGVTRIQKPFNGKSGYSVIPDRKTALAKIAELANPEDVVLIAGKGHEDYQIIGTQKFPFDDSSILKEFLA